MRRIISKALSIFIIIVGATVVVGWFYNIAILKSILPAWPTMKFTTALSFFCSGFILIFIKEYFKGNITTAFTFLPMFCLTIFLIMTSIIISMVLNVKTGIENLFIQEDVTAILTSLPGRPSIGTIVSFLVISVTGICTLMQLKHIQIYLFVCGAIVSFIGAVALIGYTFGIPALYFYIEDQSTAMAFHTAILFLIIGILLIEIPKIKNRP